MRLMMAMVLIALLTACSSSPRYPAASSYSSYNNYNNSYSNTQPNKKPQASSYSSNTYVKTTAPVPNAANAQSNATISNFERLSYEDLVRFEIDCDKRVEQTALLEEQLRRNRFYTVDGVEGNTYPGKISKSYYSLTKYRIWSLRFACQGSEVGRNILLEDLRAGPSAPPTTTPRCYFEETVEAKTGLQQTHYLASEHKATRKEICTNFPYMPERPMIRVGEQMQFTPRDHKDGVSSAALRKWKGNIYRLVSKTEIHLNQAVRFTLVTVRSGVNQWTVVDKF